MLFREIFKELNFDFTIIKNDSINDINDIVLNSKTANKDNIFVAIKGFNTDGHKYIIDAYNKGCRDFVIQDENCIGLDNLKFSTIIKVPDSRKTLGVLSNHIFNYPFLKLKLIGITGTKGKTTVSTLLHHLISYNFKASLFTTINNVVGNEITDSVRTTMEANELQRLLKKSLDSGDSTSVVEVSSHAVTLNRIYGIQWDIGIFTSFSRDHLDLYGTMDNYFNAKLDFFKGINKSIKKNKFVVINIDDPKGDDVVKVIDDSVEVIRVGKKVSADCFIDSCESNDKGISIKMIYKGESFEFKSGLRGEFNISNLALATITALKLGVKPEDIQRRLDDFTGVSGRFEIIITNPFKVIVDYAHTPQSLENILLEGRKLTDKRVVLLFGCTGERDKEKRPIMGEIAARLSDYIVLTNDDTYNENPQSIVEAVESGFINEKKIKDRDYTIIFDRKKAIEHALKIAEKDDVLILAGMGHEKVQILNNGQIEHNDKEIALKIFKKLNF